MKNIIVLIGMNLVLASCGVNETTLEKAKQQATAEEEANLAVQKKSQSEKALRMESDLKSRHVYYQAVAGKYEGKLRATSGEFNISITLVPSIPPYTDRRERQLSEIENDLNNLFFFVQVVQWHPDSKASAVGCKISGVRPNVDAGYLVLASNECPNLYKIFLSDSTEERGREIASSRSQQVSEAVRSGGIQRVVRLVGGVQPSTIADTYSFDVARVEE